MLAVVSPAKKLDTVTSGRSLPFTQPSLLSEAEILVRQAKQLGPAALQALMGISENLATLNHDRFQQFNTPFTALNAKPAALIFNGDTYTGLDALTMSGDDLAWAQDHLAILSGLYGILRPLDLIQPYRLEMGTRMKTPRGANLYAFWGDRITKQITERLAEHEDQTVVNLASIEYFKSVKRDALTGAVITPSFKEMRDGKLKMISFMAKKARGMMARHIIDGRIDRPEGLKDFKMEDYRFDAATSTDTTWSFIR
jgi:cytoplasmic iron level regulating protein YaaA (DUF328/UPF0246 family)